MPRWSTASIFGVMLVLVPIGVCVVFLLFVVVEAAHAAAAVVPTVWTLAALSAGVGAWWFLVVREPRAQREIDARLNEVDEAGVIKALESHLGRHSADPKFHAQLMLASLVQRGHVGLTARACDEDKRQQIEPIDVPFEPIPLNEADPSFAELQSSFGLAGSTHEGVTAQQADDADLRRRVTRNLRFAGGWFVPVVFVVLAAFLAYDLATGASIDPVNVFWFVMVSASLLGIRGRGAWKSTKQWLLVSGGMVARKPARKKSQWQVHVFDRRRSVLLIRQQNSSFWSVRVADGEVQEVALLTQVEAHTLLRAWLSPLAPPPVEQLSDLE